MNRLVGILSVTVVVAVAGVGGPGCGKPDPRVPSAPPGVPPATADARPAPPPKESTMTEVSLTAKVPVALPGGVSLTLVDVLEAHVTDRAGQRRNDFLVRVTATWNGETRALTLHRLAPDPGDPIDVFGTRLVLVMGDAYHQPGTAVVLVGAVGPITSP